MKFTAGRQQLLKTAIDVLLVGLPLLAFYFLAPQAVYKIQFTYGLFYNTTQQCFPNLTGVAFSLLFVIPQLFTALLFFLLFTRITAFIGFGKIAGWLLNKSHTVSEKYNQAYGNQMAGFSRAVANAAKYILPALFIIYLLVRFTWVDGGHITHLVQQFITRVFIVLLLAALILPLLFNHEKKKSY